MRSLACSSSPWRQPPRPRLVELIPRQATQPKLPDMEPLPDSELVVATPERVSFDYQVAGLGTRAIAQVLDLLIVLGILTAVYFVALASAVAGSSAATPVSFDYQVAGLGTRAIAQVLDLLIVLGILTAVYFVALASAVAGSSAAT